MPAVAPPPADPVARRRRARPLTALASVVLALAVAAPAVAPAAEAAPPSTDGPTAAAFGARWSAARVNAQGFVPNPDSSPNVSATVETAVSLAFTHVDRPTFDRVVGWLEANVETVIRHGSDDSPGDLGYLLMVATVAGRGVTAFGGVDLPARLGATLGLHAPGLYGAADPTYDGAFRQSLAILGLVAAGRSVPTAAVTWLVDQQCGASPSSAAGGWQPYRASTAVPCDAPDPTTFVGPDTNSTALAVQALERVGQGSAAAAGLTFLAGAQAAGGAFGFLPGADPDPNSTGLVIQAIVAGGEDPSAGRWAKGSGALGALLAWQLGCTAAADEIGSFSSPYSDGAPDAFATRQATWGASRVAFPPAAGTFAAAPVPCQAPTTTTTTTAPPSSTTSTTSTTAPSVVPVTVEGSTVVVPAFTG
ncbi:MAG: hypothetical protein U0Q07_02540 [Acidimicrobiales bacterium]